MNRVVWAAAVATLMSACNRSFPSPPAQGSMPPGALASDPAALLLAVDEVGVATLTGGSPPYQVSAATDAGCIAELGSDGGVVVFPGCLVPFLQNTINVTDSKGTEISIPVSIGAPFESSVAGATVHTQGCTPVPITLSGGQSPYSLQLADGNAFPSCGASGLTSLSNLTSFEFNAPAYSADGGNSYEVELLDEVESLKQPNPNPRNVITLTLVVDPVAIAPPGSFAANPAALLLAVDEPATLALSGGYPPYQLLPSPDAGCGITLSDTTLSVMGCPSPNYQGTVIVADSAPDGGTALSIPIAVGSAFQANLESPIIAASCATVSVSLTGGLAPYHLFFDGGDATACDGGTLWELQPTGLTTSTYLAPAFVTGGANSYAVQLMDDVEFQKATSPSGQVNPENVINFVLDVQGPTAASLAASPAALNLAVDQSAIVTLLGGQPPYQIDAGAAGGCNATVDGGFLYFEACPRANVQGSILVTDASDGGAITIPVTIGAAFQTDIGQSVSATSCQSVRVSVTGGSSPYHVVLDGGASLPTCVDAGAPEQGLTSFEFFVPAFTATGANTYALQLMDDIEYRKEPTPSAFNVTAFTLTVQPTPPVVTLPVTRTVAPLQSFPVATAFPGRTVSAALAYNGNSSNGSLDSSGTYTAGANPNTVDHLIVTDESDPGQGPYDLWVLVGSPSVIPQFFGGGVLLAGDINGDGIDDLLELGQSSNINAALAIVEGSASQLANAPTLYVPSGNLQNVELADVNGDGLQDVVLSYQDNNSNPSNRIDCRFRLSSSCLPEGGPNPQSVAAQCNAGPDGGLANCEAFLFADDGSLARSFNANNTGTPNVVQIIATGPDLVGTTEIDCTGQGFGQATCTAGCIPVPFSNGTTGEFCTGGWTCGPSGCAPSASHNYCNSIALDAGPGILCPITEYFSDGTYTQSLACPQISGSSYACGPFTCTDDGFGGYDCGPQNCVSDGQGNFDCVTSSCNWPSAGFDHACGPSGPGQPATCASCHPPPTSDVLAFTSIPGGGFLNVGEIPGAGSTLVADLGGGQLILGGGYELQGSSTSGVQSYTYVSGPSLQLNHVDSNPNFFGQAESVRVAHLIDGTPWALVQVTDLEDEPQRLFRIDWDAAAGAGSFTVNAPVNANRSLSPVAFVDFNGVSGESIVIANVGDGGVDLSVFDPPGGACPTLGYYPPDGGAQVEFPLGDGGFGLGAPPIAGTVTTLIGGTNSQIDQLLSLSSVHGVAVGVLPPGAVQLGDVFTPVTRPAGCTLTQPQWSSLALPLDGAVYASMVSGDFNGDGQGDLAVSSLESLDFYPGNLGGSFAQGDQYLTTNPIAQLSASLFPDGGGVVVGFDLEQNAHLFALANNTPPPAPGNPTGTAAPVSHLAELKTSIAPNGSALGAALLGPELWVVGTPFGDAGLSSLVLTRYPDATNLGPNGNAVPLAGIPTSATGLDYSQLVVPVPGRREAAWVVVDGPGTSGPELYVGYISAPADGGHLDVLVSASAFPPNAVGASFEVQGDGGLELAFYSAPASYQLDTYSVSGGQIAVQSTPVAQNLPFIPLCEDTDGVVVVQGGSQLILPGIPKFDGGPACNPNGSSSGTLYLYDLATNTTVPIKQAPPNSEPHRAFLSPFPDGGEEIIAFAVHAPGLLGILPRAGGAWVTDPAYVSNGQFISGTAYPSTDGQPRHVISQVSPASLQVLSR